MPQRPPMMFVDPRAAADGKSPAVRDMSGEWRAFMGITQQAGSIPVNDNVNEYGQIPADEPWVYSCVNKRAQAAQSVPLRVYVKDGENRIAASLTTNAAALAYQHLLDTVNASTMTGSDLKYYTEGGLVVWGEGYWKKVRGRRGGAPQELWWLRAPDVTVKKMAGGRIVGYSWRDQSFGTSLPEDYQPQDVIPFRNLNLQDPTRGLSPLASVRYAINVNQQASVLTASTLANWGIPAGAWVAPKGAEIGPQEQRSIRSALRALRGPRNQGKTPILPEGLDWKPLAQLSKDAEYLQGQKVSRMAICAATGVPLVLAGDDDKNTVYGNLRDAERIFWRLTMIPELDRIADSINNWLTPDFDPTGTVLEVAFDYSEIEALQEPLSAQWNSWLGAVDRKIATPNMFISKFRMGAPVPWGDEPILTTRVTLAGVVDPAAVIGATGLPPENEQTAPVTLDDEETTQSSPEAALRGIPSLYRHPAVRAFLEAPGEALDTGALGFVAPIGVRHHLERGLVRRYSVQQLIDGVPSERFPALSEVIP